MKNKTIGIFVLIGICSLAVNAFYFQTQVNHKHQMKHDVSITMNRVAGNLNQANRWMSKDKTAAIGRLAEASGSLSTLNSELSKTEKEATRKNLYAVAYYLHFQETSKSSNGLSSFMMKASHLLQSHVSKGRYQTSYFSSDLAELDRMLPKSFR